MNLNKHSLKAIREFIGDIPEHIEACASAVRYDLLYGPTVAVIPEGDITKFDRETFGLYSDAEDAADECDEIEETYTGQVGDALRAFIDDLPSTLYIDTCCDFVTDTAPDSCEECYACDGSGIDESGFADSDDDSDLPECEICDGERSIEVDLSYWYTLGAKDVVEALFGPTIARHFS